MKKKEVIFYDGNAFRSIGGTLELKAGNKGTDHGMGYMREIQLTERKIKNFWKKMDEIDVWGWEKNYSPVTKFVMVLFGSYVLEIKMEKQRL